jgi:hypothetical protein
MGEKAGKGRIRLTRLGCLPGYTSCATARCRRRSPRSGTTRHACTVGPGAARVAPDQPPLRLTQIDRRTPGGRGPFSSRPCQRVRRRPSSFAVGDSILTAIPTSTANPDQISEPRFLSPHTLCRPINATAPNQLLLGGLINEYHRVDTSSCAMHFSTEQAKAVTT